MRRGTGTRAGLGRDHADGRVTGLARETSRKGSLELRDPTVPETGRIRRPGGGRQHVEVSDPAVRPTLQEVVEASTAGSPRDVLDWTSKSKAKLATALAARGHQVSPNTVGRLLRDLGYRRQANRQDKEGRAPPQRDAQVSYLNQQARAFLDRGQPVIPVDTKQKALVGDFKNGGRTWRPKGEPVRVQVHDFPSLRAGKAVPSGIDDLAHTHGLVNVGTSHDPPDFAVESIRLWWEHEANALYPAADALLILADSGGRHSARSRVWKVRVQELADRLQLPITVCHLPPGTSKWNKIEHRLFADISVHWRGQPLVDYQTVVSRIGTTTTTTGLTVTARLDLDHYPTGVRIPASVLAQVALQPHPTHPQWNYTLSPRSR